MLPPPPSNCLDGQSCAYLAGALSYVKLYLLPDRSKSGKRKSSTQKSQLEPNFDEKFTFGPVQFSQFSDKTLWLSVWHKDRLGRNDFLGEILLPLSQVRHQLLSSDLSCRSTGPRWYQLGDRVSILTSPGLSEIIKCQISPHNTNGEYNLAP